MAMAMAGAGASQILVEEGDTLWSLAERLGVHWRDLQAANGLEDDVIYAGEVLQVPPRPWLSTSCAPWRRPTKPLVVELGDTAWDISERFGLSVEDLQEMNSIVLDVLFPGDVLNVPDREDVELRPHRDGLKLVKARVKGLAGFADAKFFDVFPPPKDIDEYRTTHRMLLNALRHVETSFIMPAPTGDGGHSIGPLQIGVAYHEDAWWLDNEGARYEYCEQLDYAERTVINYWLRYCPWALEFNDVETLARTHNGGPQFWYHLSTGRYWRRVRRALKKQGYCGFSEFRTIGHGSGTILLFNTHLPLQLTMLDNGLSSPAPDAQPVQTTLLDGSTSKVCEPCVQ